jgi:hypothetical protein
MQPDQPQVTARDSRLQPRAGAPAGSRHWRLFAVGVFVLLVWIRMPEITRHGRFWAEEGSVYFENAWRLPWWQALLRPHVGYLNLAPNLATLLARYIVSLPHAPNVTTAIALAIQTLPALLLATARDTWLRNPVVLFAAMLILAMPPVCDEVWLNTALSQFHLALAAGLCLALDVPVGAGAALRAVLLLFAPLSSPASIALAPLFVLRAILDRQPGRALQAACMVTGTILQLTLFYTRDPVRAYTLAPVTLAAILAIKHLAIPLLGEHGAEIVAPAVQATVREGRVPIAALLALAAAGGLLLTAIMRCRQPAAAWMLLAGGAIAVLSYFGALNSGVSQIAVFNAQRYAFAPSMLFALTVLTLAATGTGTVAFAARAIVVWLLTIAVLQTVSPQDAFFAHGPSWKAEVARFRADPSHKLAIWPTGWVVQLPPATAMR